jgi:hypothetical protein
VKVTDEMVDRAASTLSDFKHPTGKRAVRNALEAALVDVPEPRQTRQIARELLEAKERIAYLEAKLAERSRS